MQTQQIERSEPSALPSCSILVLSCDRYRDLWTPFFKLFSRYWSDCQMTIHLGSNSAQAGLAQIQTLTSGVDEAWGRRLRLFLQDIQTDYVLLLLEDFFLDQPVSMDDVNEQLKLLHHLGGTCMRLFPNPPADYIRGGVGQLHSHAAFRVSMQAAIWNRAQLMNLLVDRESPWEFEVRGSRRSRSLSAGFYCATRPVIHYRHVVERGEWFRDAARFYAQCDIGCDFTARPVMGPIKTWKKKRINRVRRILNRAHSRWLCLARPE